MADFFITGKKGAGKSLLAVSRIKEVYLARGSRVATNLDLFMEHISRDSKDSKPDVIRLPDKPRMEDLEALGPGSTSADENTFGAIVLDELGIWFNGRNWRDPGRKAILDWLAESRKVGWDVYYMLHDIDTVDAQARNNYCEHLVTCSRMDRLKIPFLSTLLTIFGIKLRLPKIHLASVRYGDHLGATVVDRWFYLGTRMYSSYDTKQRFRDDFIWVNDTGRYDDKYIIDRKDGKVCIDMRAIYTYLPGYYITGQAEIDYQRRRLAQLSDAQRVQVEIDGLKHRVEYLIGHRKKIFSGRTEIFQDEESKQRKRKAQEIKRHNQYSAAVSYGMLFAVVVGLYMYFTAGGSQEVQAQPEAKPVAQVEAAPIEQAEQAPPPAPAMDYLESVLSDAAYTWYLDSVMILGHKRSFLLTGHHHEGNQLRFNQDDFIRARWSVLIKSKMVRLRPPGGEEFIYKMRTSRPLLAGVGLQTEKQPPEKRFPHEKRY